MLATYVAGRELLGRHDIPSGDPVADATRICELLGGRRLAGAYIVQMLAELEPHWPVDADGRRIDYQAVYGNGSTP